MELTPTPLGIWIQFSNMCFGEHFQAVFTLELNSRLKILLWQLPEEKNPAIFLFQTILISQLWCRYFRLLDRRRTANPFRVTSELGWFLVSFRHRASLGIQGQVISTVYRTCIYSEMNRHFISSFSDRLPSASNNKHRTSLTHDLLKDMKHKFLLESGPPLCLQNKLARSNFTFCWTWISWIVPSLTKGEPQKCRV